MSKTRIPKTITDGIWKRLEAALATAKHSAAGAPPKMTDRGFLEALLYLNRTGTPWRKLPAEFGDWDVVYMRFRRWSERGVWQRLWEALQPASFDDARELLLDGLWLPQKGRRTSSGASALGDLAGKPRGKSQRKRPGLPPIRHGSRPESTAV